ncbi:MAG: hypothetical protein L6427_07605 [Actinomycetia bacterium]|nr:hypothetical protein [Actinomycetes bacterium]
MAAVGDNIGSLLDEWNQAAVKDKMNINQYNAVLEKVADAVVTRLSDVNGVTRVLGVGSYYIPKNKPPSDLDFLLFLDFSLTDTDKTRSLGESVENIQKEYSGDKYGKNVRSIVSLFLKDIDGYFLNGEQLFNWFNDDFGFTLEELQEETIKTEKHRIGWDEARVLWRHKK